MGKDTIQAPTGSEDLKVWADAPEVQLLLPLEDSGGLEPQVAATPAAQRPPTPRPGHTQAAPAQRSRSQGSPCSPELDSISGLLTQKSAGHVSERSPPTRPLRASGSSGRHGFLVVPVLPKSGHHLKRAGMPPRDSLGMRHTLQAPPCHPAELTVVTL